MTAVVDADRRLVRHLHRRRPAARPRSAASTCTRRAISAVMTHNPRIDPAGSARRRGGRADGEAQDRPAAGRRRRGGGWSARSTSTTSSGRRSSEGMDAALERARGVRLMVVRRRRRAHRRRAVSHRRRRGAEALPHARRLRHEAARRRAASRCALITGRNSRAVANRAAELGIAHVLPGHRRQARRVREPARRARARRSTPATWATTWRPAGARALRLRLRDRAGRARGGARARALRDARRPGGGGAVREVCELMLRAQGTLERALGRYLA